MHSEEREEEDDGSRYDMEMFADAQQESLE